MAFDDKIYFLEDILDEYEKKGGDKEAAEAMYWYFLEQTTDKIINSDEVVFKIPKFGNLYFPISSLHNVKKRIKLRKAFVDKKNHKKLASIDKQLYIVDSKISKLDSLVQKAIKNKVKNIWFFRTRFYPKNIKNE